MEMPSTLTGVLQRWRLATTGKPGRGLKQLRWITIVVPLLFLGVIDLVRHYVWPSLLHTWYGYSAILLLVGIGVYFFSNAVFDYIEAMEKQLVEQNENLTRINNLVNQQARQLKALYEAGLALSSDLRLEVVLQRVVDLARELVGSRYGSLSILDPGGNVVRFLTSGISHDEMARMGNPPRGLGLLGAVVKERRPIRVDNISQDPRSVGFPPWHPTMTSFIGVPITFGERVLGSLYLTDKLVDGQVVPFDSQDEEVLKLFANQASVAMENARLHAEMEGLAAVAERERIARELHDSLAQVLGYIRLRSAVALDANQKCEIDGVRQALEDIAKAAEDAYADIREAILGLRTTTGPHRNLLSALSSYLEWYQRQSGIDVRFAVQEGVDRLQLAPGAEAQLLRIIQEALTNARKHSGATQVQLQLQSVTRSTGVYLQATVADNGRGFDPNFIPDGGHFGLSTMRERAAMAGGSLRIDSTPGKGTRVTVEVPAEVADLAGLGQET